MTDLTIYKEQLQHQGFTILEDIFSPEQVDQLISLIDLADRSKITFRKSADLFAIRQFLKEVPDVTDLVFNENFQNIIQQVFGEGFFVVKSIYFDKPEQSNWFVSYHQDLTISVDRKVDVENYVNWTVKPEQFAVQPPINILKSIFTVRIHLDDTDENNGALKVVPTSHLNICKPQNVDWQKEIEVSCNVKKGGIMIMRPLLLHSSGRTTNHKKRRVIHIEFCNQELPDKLHWAERIQLSQPIL